MLGKISSYTSLRVDVGARIPIIAISAMMSLMLVAGRGAATGRFQSLWVLTCYARG